MAILGQTKGLLSPISHLQYWKKMPKDKPEKGKYIPLIHIQLQRRFYMSSNH